MVHIKRMDSRAGARYRGHDGRTENSLMGVEGKNESKILWAPWRMSYIKKNKSDGCIFCSAQGSPKDEENLVVHRQEGIFVMMNRFPYAHGHLLVFPGRHVKDLSGLTPRESMDLILLVRDAIGVLDTCFHPEGYNVGINLGRVAGAGYAGHLHVHIVPRWNGDYNFMPVIAETRVISEHLEDTYRRLAEAFKKIKADP